MWLRTITEHKHAYRKGVGAFWRRPLTAISLVLRHCHWHCLGKHTRSYGPFSSSEPLRCFVATTDTYRVAWSSSSPQWVGLGMLLLGPLNATFSVRILFRCSRLLPAISAVLETELSNNISDYLLGLVPPALKFSFIAFSLSALVRVSTIYPLTDSRNHQYDFK